MATTKRLTATFNGQRKQLPEGRAWLVQTEKGHRYIVTFFKGWNGYRFGTCQCKAYNCGMLCRHLLFAANADAMLTGVPTLPAEEIKRVPVEPFEVFAPETEIGGESAEPAGAFYDHVATFRRVQ